MQFFRLLSSLMKDTSSVFFLLERYLLWKKGTPQSQTFRLLSGWVKFHQILDDILETTSQFLLNFASLLVSWEINLPYFFSYSVIWFGQKSYSKVKKKFVSKMSRIWWILIWALKSLNNLQFDCSLFCKVYNVWLKKYKRAIFHDTEVSCKVWRKEALRFEKWYKEFRKFPLEHLEVSKLGLWWDSFVQNRKCMS